ncbi:hypothetical protein, partial [Pseudomonas lactis]|uniref:hypothetical protein n=1 Tax=Pseudomonas lactis TaxID=1615674 RepID=UPI003F80F920
MKTWQREQRFAALTSSSILVTSEKSSRVLTLIPSSTTFGALFFRGAIVHINPAIKYTKSCCVGDTWMPEIRTDS